MPTSCGSVASNLGAVLHNPPLPIVDGLNPSRVRVESSTTAEAAIRQLIGTQRHIDPADDANALAARFHRGEIRLDNGTVLAAQDPISAGTFVWFYRQPAPERAVPGTLQLLYQDDNVLVVDKPPFMSTLPRGQHITETAVVRARRQFNIDALSPAHRLDRLTQGVLLFTTHQEVRGRYQQLFEKREVHKVYEAVTERPERWEDLDSLLPVPEGALGPGSVACTMERPSPERPWNLEHRLIKERGRLAAYIEPGSPNSLTSVTGIRELEDDSGRLVWRLEPHSGRTHQLRVNMRLFGTPIVNDPLYAELSDEALYNPDAPLPWVPAVADEDFDFPMGLIARELAFEDPLDGTPHRFISSLPL